MDTVEEEALLLRSYTAFAKYLFASLGVECSLVLYRVDAGETDGQVLEVFGDDGAHRIGDPMTPFIKELLIALKKTSLPGLTHVDTEASTANGRVKLNIFAIRLSGGRIIGLLILCTAIDGFYCAREVINRYLGYQTAADEDTMIKATNAVDSANDGDTRSLSEYMQQLIRDEIEAFSVPVERMTIEEKRVIIHRLEKLEVFYVRDSVRTAANLLNISVPTVYRLLKKDSAPN